jgi:hypothetical protein
MRPIIDGIDSALRHEQREEGAGHREHQGGEDGHRLHEILEQQDQHDVDAEHAGRHGQAEALEQLGHRLGIADGGLQHARRQVLQAGQGHRPLLDLAERLAVQLDLEIDVAQAVVAVDLGRPAGDGQRGDVADGHRPVPAGHRHAFEQGEVRRAPGGSLTTMGTWRWARLSLARSWS